MRAAPILLAGVALATGCSGDAGPSDGRSDTATTTSAYRLETVARGLDAPVYVTAPGEDGQRLYVVLKRGIVRTLDGGRLRPEPFLDISGQISSYAELGLHSIAFHPSYADNGLVYAAFNDDGDERAVTVVEYRVNAGRADPRTARVLVRVPHRDSPYHNGGQLMFGPDGRLYVGVGDGGYLTRGPRAIANPHGNAENLDVLLGKLFRLDVDTRAARPEIVAYGLRNQWRFSFHPERGDILIGDVGYQSWEEIDVLPAGSGLVDFGWSAFEGRDRRGDRANTKGRLVAPALTYRTGERRNCSVIGGFVYRGRAVPRLAGRYVFGDYCSGRVWSVRLDGSRASDLRVEPVEVPSLVSFGEDAAAELYAVSIDGAVYRFSAR